MCGHGGERRVKVWVLDHKCKKTPACFLVDGHEPETSTVHQFHGCHWHGLTCINHRAIKETVRYKDTWQIDRLIQPCTKYIGNLLGFTKNLDLK